jgi:hypothetical protein
MMRKTPKLTRVRKTPKLTRTKAPKQPKAKRPVAKKRPIDRAGFARAGQAFAKWRKTR